MKRHHVSLILIVTLLLRADAAQPDISLRAAIDSALEYNLAYRRAALDPEVARQSVVEAESAFDTELFGSARLAQSEQSTTFSQTTGTSSDNRALQVGARKRFSYGTTVTARTNLDRRDSNAGVNTSNLSQAADLSLDIRQPLLSGFGRAANLAATEGAQAAFVAAREGFRDTLQRIVAETEQAYWTVAQLQEQLELNESSLRVAEALVEEAREREQVGVATRIEVLQAEAARAQRLEEIIETRRQLGEALDQLYRYMGVLPPEFTEGPEVMPRVEVLTADKAASPDFHQAWEFAQIADPALARQEAVIAQRESQREAARNGLQPSLDLILSGAYSGVDDRRTRTAFGNALDRDGHAWAVGVEFSMPWRMRGERATLLGAEKRLEQESLRYEELKQSLFRELRSAWRSLDAVNQSLEAAMLTVSLQEATFEREKGKYEEGLSAFREVLEAQRDLDQARIRLLRSKFNKLSSEIEMARLTGRLLQRHGL
jgi:outer membrane protein